jgi:hypothetical protein
MKYIKLFENFLILEKLTEVNEDVDFIYNKYFKSGIDYIQENDKLDLSLFPKNEISSSELKSSPCQKAHQISPVKININNLKYNNSYIPSLMTINISLSRNAVNHAQWYPTISEASNILDNKNSFLQEFTEHKIKGSIHHELVHWIDDVLNNRHIANKLIRNTKIKNIDFTEIEIQAQIHNIVQLKRKYGDIWDSITFDEMIKMSPPLNVVLKSDGKERWIFKLKKRMAREGLLGKKMYN